MFCCVKTNYYFLLIFYFPPEKRNNIYFQATVRAHKLRTHSLYGDRVTWVPESPGTPGHLSRRLYENTAMMKQQTTAHAHNDVARS